MSKKSKNNKPTQTAIPQSEEHILVEPTIGSWLKDFFVGIYQWVNPLKIISVMFFLYAFYALRQHPNAMNLFFDKKFLQAGMNAFFVILCAVIGLGLWRQRNWARLASGIFLAIIFIFFAVMGIVSFHYIQAMLAPVEHSSSGGAGVLLGMLVFPLVVYLSMIVYLFRRKTKEQCITLKMLREEKSLKKQLKNEHLALKKMQHAQKEEEKKHFVPETLED